MIGGIDRNYKLLFLLRAVKMQTCNNKLFLSRHSQKNKEMAYQISVFTNSFHLLISC